MATAIVDDFERRRRVRETASERVLCIVLVCAGVVLLLVESAWRALMAAGDSPATFFVSAQARLVTLAILGSHLAVLGLLAVRSGYDPRRKYLLVVMRVGLMGAMCWAQWYSRGPEYGLSSGPVAAGYVGTERYVQYAVIGDTTNVASRVCTAAAAGEILVTESTRVLLDRPGVRLEPLPPVAVKGKAEPLVLHRVVPPQESAA